MSTKFRTLMNKILQLLAYLIPTNFLIGNDRFSNPEKDNYEILCGSVIVCIF